MVQQRGIDELRDILRQHLPLVKERYGVARRTGARGGKPGMNQRRDYRDKLIHDYVSVNLEVVWKTLTEDLPPLLPMIERVIDETPQYRQGLNVGNSTTDKRRSERA